MSTFWICLIIWIVVLLLAISVMLIQRHLKNKQHIANSNDASQRNQKYQKHKIPQQLPYLSQSKRSPNTGIRFVGTPFCGRFEEYERE